MKVEVKNGVVLNVFTNNILCRLKIGSGISYLHNLWLGNQSLKDAFLKAYVEAIDKFGSVANMGWWDNGV